MTYLRWFLLSLIVLCIAGFSRSWVLAWFFYALAGALALAASVSWRPAKLLAARRRMSSAHVEFAETVNIDVSLGWDRPVGAGWVLASDALPPALQSATPPGRLFVGSGNKEASFTYRLTGIKRGYHPVGPLTVTSGDLFGIAKVVSTEDEQDFLTVYPRVLQVPSIHLPSNRPIGEVATAKRTMEDPTRLVGIREYQHGDTFARIHWKATARAGKMMSKIYEPSCSVEMCVVLNLFAKDYPEEETVVELACTTAASITAAMIRDGQLVGIQSNGDDAAWKYAEKRKRVWEPPGIKGDRSQVQLAGMLALIARLLPTQDRPLASYLHEIHSRLPWTSTALVITHALDEQATQSLEALCRSGFALAAVIVGGGERAEEARARAAGLGMPVAWIEKEEHLGSLEFWRPGRG